MNPKSVQRKDVLFDVALKELINIHHFPMAKNHPNRNHRKKQCTKAGRHLAQSGKRCSHRLRHQVKNLRTGERTWYSGEEECRVISRHTVWL